MYVLSWPLDRGSHGTHDPPSFQRLCEDKVSVLGSMTVSDPWSHTLVSVGVNRVILHRIAFWKLSRAASSRAFKLDH